MTTGKRNREFLVPEEKVKGLIYLIQEFEVGGSVPAESLFSDLNKKHTKVGTLLRGAKLREAMTQKQLADKLEIPQSHISEKTLIAFGTAIARTATDNHELPIKTTHPSQTTNNFLEYLKKILAISA